MENATVGSRNELLSTIANAVHERVVGQDEAVEALIIALLTGGHILLEGLPGLTKTVMVRTLAEAIHTGFRRIQFTPDLLPTDIVGTPIFDQGSGDFKVHKGPIFSNIILADEINRAPEKTIARRVARRSLVPLEPVATVEDIAAARDEVEEVHLDDKILDYIVELAFATREPSAYGLGDLEDLIEFGASPRATIFLSRTSRAWAYLHGRSFVMPDDVKAMAPLVLHHRLRTTYEADARGIGADEVTRRVLEAVPSP